MSAALEYSEIQFGLTPIRYRVVRSGKRRTVALSIVPNEGVVLTAPMGLPLARLDGLVRAKGRWILERLRESPRQSVPALREFVSGESFNYLGRQHRLRVVERLEAAPVRLGHGRFMVTISKGLRTAARASAVRASLMEWYREHAGPRLAERVAYFAKRMQIVPPQVVLSAQRRRWGSCTANGTVRLNWRIVQAAPRLIDYVVAHELAHLRVSEHSPAFWKALAVVMPDYEERRQRLRDTGAGLEW